MSDPFVTNDGKTLHVLEVGDGSWGWAVWDPSDIRSCNSGVADSRKAACAAAEKAVGIAPSEPPAPPAWMVEVARGGAEDPFDFSPEQVAIRALRLALERGHVVVSGAVGPVAPSVDLKAATNRAWDEGYITAENALARIRKGLGVLGEHFEEARDADVAAIIASLLTREA